MYADNPEQLEAMSSLGEAELADMLDQYLASDTLDDESLLMIYDTYISPGSYDDNMTAFGWVSLDAPSSISIYADSFEDKDLIAGCIEDYNATTSSENQIHYTDYVGLLMSSVTTIVDVISYVLIAFCLRIAHRLFHHDRNHHIYFRSGTDQGDRYPARHRRLQNATWRRSLTQRPLSSGFVPACWAWASPHCCSSPSTRSFTLWRAITTINASLPIVAAGFLVLLSMLLTMIAGLLPSGKAAKKDPVTALRTE